MRLWHKDLIRYLPNKQLKGQWRELNSIYRRSNKHLLINFVYENDLSNLYWYTLLILNELDRRNYKYNTDNFVNYFYPDIRYSVNFKELDYKDIYKKKMTKRYLKQCLYNLQEKYDCGGISTKEWKLITDNFKEYLI